MGLRSLTKPPVPGSHNGVHLQSSAQDDVKVDNYKFASPLCGLASEPAENVFTFDTPRGEGDGKAGEKTGGRKEEEEEEMEVQNVTCFIMMLDLLLRQVSVGRM